MCTRWNRKIQVNKRSKARNLHKHRCKRDEKARIAQVPLRGKTEASCRDTTGAGQQILGKEPTNPIDGAYASICLTFWPTCLIQGTFHAFFQLCKWPLEVTTPLQNIFLGYNLVNFFSSNIYVYKHSLINHAILKIVFLINFEQLICIKTISNWKIEPQLACTDPLGTVTKSPVTSSAHITHRQLWRRPIYPPADPTLSYLSSYNPPFFHSYLKLYYGISYFSHFQ